MRRNAVASFVSALFLGAAIVVLAALPTRTFPAQTALTRTPPVGGSPVAAAGQNSAPVASAIPELPGYRLDDYRAPVPATIHGGKVIHPRALAALMTTGHAVLIDVLPAPRRPADAPADRPWLPLPHRSLPNSLWFPDVGRGAISPALDTWFRERLAVATSGNRGVPVVFYCLSQCWMSWNATKRAISYGYTQAIWLPDGTDGWEKAGYTLAVTTQEPGQP